MTFSNPQYPVHQTAPWIDQSTGKDVRTALVGDTQPLEDQSVLELPTAFGATGGGGGGGGGTPPGTITIGTVTVAGNASPAVGDTVTYTATRSGNSADTVFTFSAPGETFTGGTVTWANDGATTVTCTATSVTATDSPQTGTRAVTVTAAPISFTSFTSSSISNGQSLSSNSPYHFNGSPNGCSGNNRSPQLSWAVDDDTNVADYQVTVVDLSSPWSHWNITVPSTVTTMAEDFDVVGAGGSITQNDWATNGITGSNANGYGGPCPPGGQHNYRIQVAALDNAGNTLATSSSIDFTA